MRTLEFEVKQQRLLKKQGCDFSQLVAGSVGYLSAKFYFSKPEWESCKKVASFWLGEEEYPVVLDENDTCVIPQEVLNAESFLISVTGAKRESNKVYKLKTTKVKVKQEVY